MPIFRQLQLAVVLSVVSPMPSHSKEACAAALLYVFALSVSQPSLFLTNEMNLPQSLFRRKRRSWQTITEIL